MDVNVQQLSEALKTSESLTVARDDERWRQSVMLEREDKDLFLRAQNDHTETKLKIAAQKKDKIYTAVPHRAFKRSVDAFTANSLQLSATEERLIIEHDNRKLKLSNTDPQLFPTSLDIGQASQAALELPADVLATALELTSRCASEDHMRPTLNSVALGSNKGKLVMVGTNSYHLTKIELDVNNDVQLREPLLLHLSTAKAIAKDLKARKITQAELQLHDEGALIAYDRVSWVSRRLLGNFPQWDHLIPKEGYQLRIDRHEFEAVLKAIKAIAAGNAPVRLELGKEITVHYRSSEIGDFEEKLENTSWDGNPMTINFSNRYLEDMLKVVEGEELQGLLTTELRPAYFSSPDRGYLVMPVRSNEITDADHISGTENTQ